VLNNKTSLTLLLVICLLTGVNTVFAQAIQYTPEYQKAMQANRDSNPDLAVQVLQPLLDHPRYRPMALLEIGKIRQQQADAAMSQATMYYYEAAQMMVSAMNEGGVKGPQAPETLYQIAQLYETKLKHYPQALEIYQNIVDEYPSYLAIDKVYWSLASTQEFLSMLEEAAANYTVIVDKYPYSPHYEEARQKMTKLAPLTSEAGKSIELQQNLIDDMDHGTEYKEYVTLGDMYTQSGDYRDAADAYRDAAHLADTDEEAIAAYKKLVTILDEKLKDYDGAIEVLEEVSSKYHDAEGIDKMIFRVAMIYENDVSSMQKVVVDNQVRYKKTRDSLNTAIKYYDTLIDNYPYSDKAGEALIRKAAIHETEFNEVGEAISIYEDYLSRFSGSSRANEIREKVRYLKDNY